MVDRARREPLEFAIERMVTVMVVACPHALGLAVPLVVAVSTSLSASNGLLIRDRAAFRARAQSRCGRVRQDRHAD
jgi:Cu2+-exporting ATPase